jgi:hypothetical protein
VEGAREIQERQVQRGQDYEKERCEGRYDRDRGAMVREGRNGGRLCEAGTRRDDRGQHDGAKGREKRSYNRRAKLKGNRF